MAKELAGLVQRLVNLSSGWLPGSPKTICENNFADPIQPIMTLGPVAPEQRQIEIFDEVITSDAGQWTMQSLALISGRFGVAIELAERVIGPGVPVQPDHSGPAPSCRDAPRHRLVSCIADQVSGLATDTIARLVTLMQVRVSTVLHRATVEIQVENHQSHRAGLTGIV